MVARMGSTSAKTNFKKYSRAFIDESEIQRYLFLECVGQFIIIFSPLCEPYDDSNIMANEAIFLLYGCKA